MFELFETITITLIPTFLLLDFIVQNRRYHKTRHWRLRGFLVTAAIFFFTGEVAMFWGSLFGDFHLLDLSGVGIFTGTVLGILVYELLHYSYHRFAHSWEWLWRAGHQMHHSAESLDAFGAYYLHPLDGAIFTTLSSLVFYPLLGLSIESAVIGTLFLTFNAMFQHANIKTPHWVGYIIQRPESHNIHHGLNIHRYNYADLPVIDMLFGTYINPKLLDSTDCGFYKGASSRIVDMLIGKDVTKPKTAKEGTILKPFSETTWYKLNH